MKFVCSFVALIGAVFSTTIFAMPLFDFGDREKIIKVDLLKGVSSRSDGVFYAAKKRIVALQESEGILRIEFVGDKGIFFDPRLGESDSKFSILLTAIRLRGSRLDRVIKKFNAASDADKGTEGIYSYRKLPRDTYRIFIGFDGRKVFVSCGDAYAACEFIRKYNDEIEMRYSIKKTGLVDYYSADKVVVDYVKGMSVFREVTLNQRNNSELPDIAQRAYQATESRYKLGVSSMLELLSAQSSLATAKWQSLQALAD